MKEKLLIVFLRGMFEFAVWSARNILLFLTIGWILAGEAGIAACCGILAFYMKLDSIYTALEQGQAPQITLNVSTNAKNVMAVEVPACEGEKA